MAPNTGLIRHALAAATINRVNAWTTLNPHALTQYEQTRPDGAEDERALAGLPCGIKDNIDVAGLPTASGSAYPAPTPTRDAAVVDALRRAGAAIVGKNAMHEIAYGSTGMVSSTKPVINPRAVGRMPGGSSSGSAAAVAAGDVPFAIGTDTGGSVRVPAALCGIVGLRPTTGSLDSTGVSPLSPTLDTLGILAATVDTARVVWHAISGTAPAPQDAAGALKVGVIVDDYFTGGSHANEEVVRYAAQLLRRHGCATAPVQLGWLDTALTVYSHIVGAEAAWTHRERLSEPSPLFHPETHRRLTTGRQVPAWQYIEALRERDLIKDSLFEVFDRYDVLICPTTPITAPEQNQVTTELSGQSIDIGRALIAYTVPWSLAGGVSLTVPFGRDPNGLPTSIQVVGRPGEEIGVLKAGYILERQRNNNSEPPV